MSVEAITQQQITPQKYIKTAMDKICALLMLTILTPLFMLLALLVKCDGGPAFFVQERIGKGGAPFKCWKFRTMAVDADIRLTALLAGDAKAHALWAAERKLKHDPRITPLGIFLRKSSLDELPQLYNVLRGEMSLVGPRPISADEKTHYGALWSDYISVRPGITGLWQVSGRNDIAYPERVKLDSFYAREWSLMLDLKILLKTPLAVLSAKGAY